MLLLSVCLSTGKDRGGERSGSRSSTGNEGEWKHSYHLHVKALVPWMYVVSYYSNQPTITRKVFHISFLLHVFTNVHTRTSQEYRKCILSRESNQKLGVCHALLEMGDWQVASRLMALLPPFLPMWAPYITTSLCQMLHLSIEPLYRK